MLKDYNYNNEYPNIQRKLSGMKSMRHTETPGWTGIILFTIVKNFPFELLRNLLSSYFSECLSPPLNVLSVCFLFLSLIMLARTSVQCWKRIMRRGRSLSRVQSWEKHTRSYAIKYDVNYRFLCCRKPLIKLRKSPSHLLRVFIVNICRILSDGFFT